jgi:hypothetical protein
MINFQDCHLIEYEIEKAEHRFALLFGSYVA